MLLILFLFALAASVFGTAGCITRGALDFWTLFAYVTALITFSKCFRWEDKA